MNELLDEVLADPVFAVCAVVSVVGALTVVLRRNPVYSALGLMVAFLSFAVIFVRLDAPFLAAMHVLVYTGAILVLFLFVIMLLNLAPQELGREYPLATKGAIGVLVAALLGLLVVGMVRDGRVDRLVGQLGDRDPAARQRAETALADLGPEALHAIERARGGTEGEVSAALDRVIAAARTAKKIPQTIMKPAPELQPVTVGKGTPAELHVDAAQWGGVHHVGTLLFLQWALPFELVSVLIIAALLGAVVLAKKKLPPEL